MKFKILVIALSMMANNLLIASNSRAVKVNKVHRISEAEVNKVRKSLASKTKFAKNFVLPAMAAASLTAIGYAFMGGEESLTERLDALKSMPQDKRKEFIDTLKADYDKDKVKSDERKRAIFDLLDKLNDTKIELVIKDLKKDDKQEKKESTWSTWWNEINIIRWLKSPTTFLISIPAYFISSEINNRVLRVLKKLYKNFLNPEMSFEWYLKENTTLLSSLKDLKRYAGVLVGPEGRFMAAMNAMMKYQDMSQKGIELSEEQQAEYAELGGIIQNFQNEQVEVQADFQYTKERLSAECSNCMFELEKIIGYMTFKDSCLVNQIENWERMAYIRRLNILAITKIKNLADKLCNLIDGEMENDKEDPEFLKAVYGLTMSINEELATFYKVEYFLQD